MSKKHTVEPLVVAYHVRGRLRRSSLTRQCFTLRHHPTGRGALSSIPSSESLDLRRFPTKHSVGRHRSRMPKQQWRNETSACPF